MNAYEFTDYLLTEYGKRTGKEISGTQSGNLKDYAYGGFSAGQLESPLTKKIAARILHEFMLRIMGLKDLDWGDAVNLKDIYDCRVCANSVAQVVRRGLMKESRPSIFGMDEVLSDGVCPNIVDRLIVIESMR